MALIYLTLYPLGNALFSQLESSNERSQLADYIKKEAGDKDLIYAWDTVAFLYEESGHLSASRLALPVTYQANAENPLRLAKDLSEKQATYIAVNKAVPLTKEMEELLDKSYEKEKMDLSHFTLYHLK